VIGPDRLSRVTAGAFVPEQVVNYVCAVGDARPLMLGECLGYAAGEELVLIGYPLHDPQDTAALTQAVERALAVRGVRRLTVIGPTRPPQAPARAVAAEDHYFGLPLPAPAPAAKLRNLLRRAARELTLAKERRLEEAQAALVTRYLNERPLSPGTRHIFRRIPSYLEASAGARVVSARRTDGRLAAFAVGEFAALSTAFFMFCFRDPEVAPPGSADLVLSGLLREAQARGQGRINLGLGVNAGIRFFKRKWGAEPFLPYVETRWEPKRRGFLSFLRPQAGGGPA
jgi:hypothetical protein